MSVLKTRELLVDVARQLFAKNGFESTSMNDIALAANKGRRTLYTYFNSKEEIYLAVIQTELERLSYRMEEVARKSIPPEEKIVQLIFAHLEVMKEAVYRNGRTYLCQLVHILYCCGIIYHMWKCTTFNTLASSVQCVVDFKLVRYKVLNR